MQLLNIQLQVEHRRPPLFIGKYNSRSVSHLAEQLELARSRIRFVFTS